MKNKSNKGFIIGGIILIILLIAMSLGNINEKDNKVIDKPINTKSIKDIGDPKSIL